MQQLHSQKKKKKRCITKAIENNKSLERNCFTVLGLRPSNCGQVVKSLLNSIGVVLLILQEIQHRHRLAVKCYPVLNVKKGGR